MARVTKKALSDALQKMQGNISAAARSLGLSRVTVHARINADPDLQAVVEDARQSMVDNAESALNRAVIQGEAWAVCFTLKTQGKRRGYVERVEIDTDWREEAKKDGVNPDTLSATFEALVRQAMEQQLQEQNNDRGSSDADV